MKKTASPIWTILVIALTATPCVAGKTNPSSQAKSGPGPDAKIAGYLDSISKAQGGDDSTDALTKSNETLLDYMQKECANPTLISNKLRQASEKGLGVATSSDKKMRIYSWDTCTGGTMHFFDALAQYLVDGSPQSKSLLLHPEDRSNAKHDDPDSGWFYSSIDPIHTVDGKTVYLAMGDGTFSSIDHGVIVEAYSIENDKLVKTPFFKTEKSLLSEISCYFHNDSSGKDSGIELTDRGTTLKIPLLKGEGVPTGRFLVYKFDGHKFVYKAASK